MRPFSAEGPATEFSRSENSGVIRSVLPDLLISLFNQEAAREPPA